MPSKDIEKIRLYRRRWYNKNKERQIDRQRNRRKEIAEWLDDYKRKLSCSICGMSFSEHPECCDFHHLYNKKDTIGVLLRYSKKAVLEEIGKCVPMCANCHRIEHK